MSGQLSFHLEIRICHSDKRVAAFILCCFRSIGRSQWKDVGFSFHFCSILIVVPMKYSFFWNQDLRAEQKEPEVTEVGNSCFISKSLRVTEVSPTSIPSFSEQNKWLFIKHWLRGHTVSAPPVAAT